MDMHVHVLFYIVMLSIPAAYAANQECYLKFGNSAKNCEHTAEEPGTALKQPKKFCRYILI